MGRGLARRTTTASSIPIATRSRRPTAAPTRRACASRCCAALKDHAERIGQTKRAASVTTDDVMSGCAALISVFIREPEFQGQNKGRLMTREASRIVDGVVRDAFDHWLAARPTQAARLLDFVVERAEERLRRRAEKDVAAQDADPQAAPARQARRLLVELGGGHRTLHRRGRFGRRLGQAGARSRDPGHPAPARQDPQRRVRHARQARRQPAVHRPRAGAGLRHGRALPGRRPALRARSSS